MNNSNWRPFAAIAILIVVLFVIGFTLMAFFAGGSGAGWPGMWWMMGGMGFFWIFPVIGIVMMLTMMFHFISIFTGRGGPMDWMFGNRWRDNQPRPPSNVGDLVCPSCGSAIQPDWNVCQYCGTNLKK